MEACTYLSSSYLKSADALSAMRGGLLRAFPDEGITRPAWCLGPHAPADKLDGVQAAG